MPTGPWRTPTAARADELLGLDVVDVDLADREGQIIGKGGDAQRIFWDSEAGRLLARLIGGRTLHKIRHSRLTHLAEAGEDMTMIKAKGRHGSLRSLERYVNPSDRSVAELPARHDPNRRRENRSDGDDLDPLAQVVLDCAPTGCVDASAATVTRLYTPVLDPVISIAALAGERSVQEISLFAADAQRLLVGVKPPAAKVAQLARQLGAGIALASRHDLDVVEPASCRFVRPGPRRWFVQERL